MDKISRKKLENNSPPKRALMEREVLFAKEPMNEMWDRVVVLNYCPNQPIVRVRSLDFGCSYDVDIQNVREMNEEGAKLNIRAVKVELKGLFFKGKLTG